MSNLTQEQLIELDEAIFAEGNELLVSYMADLRDSVFNLVRAAGVDPHSIQSWSGCIGSAVELYGFVIDATDAVRTKAEAL